MPVRNVVGILFQVTLPSFVTTIMVVTGLITAIFSGKTKLQGPLLSAWLVGELFGAAVLILTCIECILYYHRPYNLQPFGYFVFQCTKLVLWAVVVLIFFGSSFNAPEPGEKSLLQGSTVVLTIVLVLFIANCVHAFFVYQDHDADNSGEATSHVDNSEAANDPLHEPDETGPLLQVRT